MPVLMEEWIVQIFNGAILQEKNIMKGSHVGITNISFYSNSGQWENKHKSKTKNQVELNETTERYWNVSSLCIVWISVNQYGGSEEACTNSFRK